MDSNNIDLLIYILITLYVGYRLFNTLGQVIDDEPTNFPRKAVNDDFIDADFEEVKKHAGMTFAQYRALEVILVEYQNFDIKKFLEGSEAFLSMLFDAINRRDLSELKHYVSAEIFRKLQADLDQYAATGKYKHITLVECKKINILSSSLKKTTAEIELEFITDQIILTKNAQGQIIDGDPELVDTITITHGFKRNMSHSNPAWTLVK